MIIIECTIALLRGFILVEELCLVICWHITCPEIPVEPAEEVGKRSMQGIEPTVRESIEIVQNMVRDVIILEIQSMSYPQVPFQLFQKHIYFHKRLFLSFELRRRFRLRFNRGDRCTPSMRRSCCGFPIIARELISHGGMLRDIRVYREDRYWRIRRSERLTVEICRIVIRHWCPSPLVTWKVLDFHEHFEPTRMLFLPLACIQ